MLLRRYCRVAAVVFVLFTIYPMVTKLLEHRLAHDWLHSLLHLASAAVAVTAGWLMRSTTLAAIFTWSVGIVYTVLGVVGWFIDGLLLGTPLAIPLGPVDNIFHLALGISGLVVATMARPGRAVEQRDPSLADGATGSIG